MKMLEIIQIRSTGQTLDYLYDQVKESIGSVDEKDVIVTVYRRAVLETDLLVQIQHQKPSKTWHASDLGLRLASALREFGLVEHTVWEVMS